MSTPRNTYSSTTKRNKPLIQATTCRHFQGHCAIWEKSISCCLIPFIEYSRNDKIIKLRTDRWFSGAGMVVWLGWSSMREICVVVE
jgi:hypothetical protein